MAPTMAAIARPNGGPTARSPISMAIALTTIQTAAPSMAAPIRVLAICSSLPVPNSSSASWPRWIRRMTMNENSSVRLIRQALMVSADIAREPPRMPASTSRMIRPASPTIPNRTEFSSARCSGVTRGSRAMSGLQPQPGAHDIEQSDVGKIDIGGMADRARRDIGRRGVEPDQRLPDARLVALGQGGEIGLSDRRCRAAGEQNRALPNPVFAFENDVGFGLLGEHRQLDVRNRRIDHDQAAIDPARHRSARLHPRPRRGDEAPDEGAGRRGDRGVQRLVISL